jgi:hypothetical protein
MLPEVLGEMKMPLTNGDIDCYEPLPHSEQVLPSWSCSTCSFINSGWLTRCEMCDTPASRLALLADTTLEDMEQSDFTASSMSALVTDQSQWPSLLEAVDSFVDCEISSVGSSWLAVAEAEYVMDDDHSDGFVAPRFIEAPASETWAARAKAIASFGQAVSLPAAGVKGPPAQRAQAPTAGAWKEVCPIEMQADDHPELDYLEERRLRYMPVRRLRAQR